MRFRHVFAAAVALLIALSGAAPAIAGDTDDVAYVDTTMGLWHFRSIDGSSVSFYYGNPGDYPFMGDWDGDGDDTPGLYRQSDGFVYLRNANTQGNADIRFFFGNPGDVPIAGDFNGDGFDTVSIYRPSNQTFYIINELGKNDAGLGAAESSYVFGNPGDKPFVGDFDGDGIDTVGLHRESTGLVYFRNTHTQGNADNQFIFGNPGDRLVAGDWTGDGIDSPALFRPSNTTTYFRYTNTQGNADRSYPFGQPSWIPVPGSFGTVKGSPSLTTETVATGLSQPLFATAPQGDARLFIVEQGGSIKILSGNQVLPTPFLRISANISVGGERGLLGMAFHPNFASNGRFFVNYTDGSGATKVVEYRADPTANAADPTPVRTIITIDQPANNHNGGMLAFGPDGYLYVGMGDGGGGGDTYRNGQNPDTLLGSMLRLDVDGAPPYTIPSSNPYNGTNGAKENWLIGLRNPWRFSFDRANGDLYIADVGQNAYEEVTVLDPAAGAGLNLGWNVMEGANCFPIGSTCDTTGLVQPTIVYGRDVGQSITGGYVYRGAAMPGLRGTYFYGDFASGMVRSFRYLGGRAVEVRDWTSTFGLPRFSLASFGEDGFGELYVVRLDGTVAKIVPAG